MANIYRPPENVRRLFEGHPDELFTVAEVAQLLKASKRSVQRWVQQGQLTAYKLGAGALSGRGTRIKRQDVVEFLKRRQAEFGNGEHRLH